jgi:hypothetical protein
MPQKKLIPVIVLLITLLPMVSTALAEVRSGRYQVAPGTLITIEGGFAPETRVLGLFGEIGILVDIERLQAKITFSNLMVRDRIGFTMPFPAEDLLALTDLTGAVISGDEVSFTEPEGEETQTAELVFTSSQAGLSLNGAYFEGCCDRYTYFFTGVELTPVGGSVRGILVPGVARTTGLNGSVWRSDVVFFNPRNSTIAVETIYISEGEAPLTASINFELEPGASYFADDILGQMLPEFSGNTKGYLRVLGAGGMPMVTATSYNQADGGVYGQALATYTLNECIAPGGRAFLVGLRHSPESDTGHRSNIGMVNLSRTTEATIRVIKDYPPDKDGLYSAKLYTLAPGQFLQRNVFRDLGLEDELLKVSLRLEVESGGPVAAYASVIDNVTQDPVLVKAQFAARPPR